MATSESVRQEIINKAKQYDVAKDEIIKKIGGYIRDAVERLEAIQKELLSEVDIKYGNNPFLCFEADMDKKTDTEAQKLLSQKINRKFGPNEESFNKLLKDIDSFRAWQEKPKYIPKGLKKSATCDSITLSWEKAERDCVYAIELRPPPPSSPPVFSCSLEPEFTFDKLNPGTVYKIRICSSMLHDEKYSWSEWSKPITILTRDAFYGSAWKKCPEKIFWKKKYDVDEGNPRIATKANGGDLCTIIGNTRIPTNRTTSWSIKILKSACNNGNNIYIGVAPFDIIQKNDDNHNNRGWYFNCWNSSLYPGSPHNLKRKTCGPKKGDGQYVHTGDSVGVVMDTTKGELSFVLNGVNLGVAYKEIPLDKPLVPCVILCDKEDSVELDTSEVKEDVDSSIPVPSNIVAKSTSQDTIALTWNEVADASFCQVEVDGSISCYIAVV